MRITPDLLKKIARETVEKRTRSDRSILSAYLHGSLLGPDPLLVGTADIDLVFIHDDKALIEREIQRLTDDVHLDITHHARSDYRRARALRSHAWLGPTIFSCRILYDPQHFMDFTQASVRGQFKEPDTVISRARPQAEHARQMWMGLNDRTGSPAGLPDSETEGRPASEPAASGIEDVNLYLRAVEHAVNAVASLTGPPLTERRFLLNYPERADSIGQPGLYHGLLGLLGGPNVDAETLRSWIPAWQAAYLAIPPVDAPVRLHPDRCAYYQKAFTKILGGDRPQDVLWPLVRTWTHAVMALPGNAEESKAWQRALEQLGLIGEGFAGRIAALDAYLDTIELALERWGSERGVSLS